MWTKLALAALALSAAAPAYAQYSHVPFHERPREVAELALDVLDGKAVAVPETDVPLAAAVAALLLVSEIGLAEAFEEAVAGDEDTGAEGEGGDAAEDGYATAHEMLHIVRPWISAVPADAETRDLIARLDALLPTPDRPDDLDADPEAAEVVAQALVGRLESAADADLYLGRDLARALETVGLLSREACEDGAGRGARIAAFYFEDALEAPLSVLAPEPALEIEAQLETMETGAADCARLAAGFDAAKIKIFPGERP